MTRVSVYVLLLAALAAPAIAQQTQRGTIKKIDIERSLVTITVDGRDVELAANSDTRIMSPDGPVRDGLAALKEGTAVMFRTATRDGKSILMGIRIGGESPPRGDESPRRATITKIDLEKMTITLSAGGQQRELALAEETQVLGVSGGSLKERLQGFTAGREVFFRVGQKAGREIVGGLRLADEPNRPANRPPAAARTPFDTSSLKPLTELAPDQYQVFEGGLYPGGKNERPEKHEAAGLALAETVTPLDINGDPDADGKIVLLSIGMSNTTQEFSLFKQMADSDPEKNHRLVIVDGAQGGMTAARIAKLDPGTPGERFWSVVDERLGRASVTRKQVQAAWIKQADAGPTQPFPRHALVLREELEQIVRLMRDRFPNLKLVYLSSRTYGGYAKTPLNPEPYAYESGFAVRWLIEHQLAGDPAVNFDPAKGPVFAPWLSWGPYLWANGTRRRSDGLSYDESDFAGDGTHPSPSGRRKVAELLLKFFKTDTTTCGWFLAPQARAAEPATESEPQSRQVNRQRNRQPQDLLFRLLDRNGDRQLSNEELAAAPEVIDRWDRDEDGLLDEAELTRGATGRRPGEIITPAAKGERHTNTLEVGDLAPDFKLPDPTNQREVALSSFRGQRPVVLIFGSFT